MTDTAIILLSGGLDSSVSLALALEEGIQIQQALAFDYGQQAATAEIQHAQKLAQHHNIPFETIELPWLDQISHSSLSRESKSEIPDLSASQLDNLALVTLESAKSVWVPNRNGLFINIAAAYADSAKYQRILVGFNAEEAMTFPDNTPQFSEASTRALAFSTRVQPRVYSAVQHLNKIEIFAEAQRLKLPFDMIWSCYRGGDKHCGRCESCQRLLRAARANDALETIAPFFERVDHA